MGWMSTGKVVETAFVIVLTISEDKITNFRLFEDSFAVSKAARPWCSRTSRIQRYGQGSASLRASHCSMDSTFSQQRAYFFSTFLLLAQRFFCAAEILARASGVMVRAGLELAAIRLGAAGEVLRDVVLPAGRPGFRLMIASVPLRSAFACCRREISASIATTKSFVFMNPPVTEDIPRY
jgi:hypothetical protein